MPRSKLAEERRRVQDGRVVVDGRVSEVHGQRVVAMLDLETMDTFCGSVQRLIPVDLSPTIAAAPERSAQAIGVVMELCERRAFRANVTLAENIVPVAADGDDAITIELDGEPAHGLAQVAGAKVSRPRMHGGEYTVAKRAMVSFEESGGFRAVAL